MSAVATAEEVLAGLDPEQRRVAEAVRGPVCVLAGAGTGKTRAITHRIAYAVHAGVVPGPEVLAVTFTTRAAGELRMRLRRLGVPDVQARTFHSAALRQLGYFFPKVLGLELPRVVESKLRLVAEAAPAVLRRPAAGPELRDLAAEIEWGKSTLAMPETYPGRAAAAGREPPVPGEQLAEVWAAYERAKTAAGVLDFEDLLLNAVGLLEQEPRVAAEVRARYRYFVVDEYQDVTPLQQRLLDGWLGGRDEVCVVGDAGQTIYTFSGASAAYLLEFPDRYPDATVVRLVRDYRSTPEVVGLANLLRDRGPAAERLHLVAQRPAGPTPRFTEYADEAAEAAGVAAACRRLLDRGVPAHEIAVLYRVNAQSATFEEALAAAGVPYVVRGAERFFDRPEVRQALMLLRAAARFPADPPAELTAAVTAALSSAGWTPEPPAGRGATRERWESLAALVRLAGELGAAGQDLPAYVAELEHRAAAQHAPPVDGVTLATLHAAKGLEWEAVFLVGLVDGTVPISFAVTAEQVAEERRLLYVGVTRARRELALSWARARSAGARRARLPSRFLAGLEPGRAKPRRSRSRADTALPPGADPALFEALRTWRRDRAKAAQQPAYCVFPDATLAEIASRRPAGPEQLGAIPGVGTRKLAEYGAEVLAIVGSAAWP